MSSTDREEALFAEALEKPAARRAAFLNQACGDDVALRARIEALLAAHDSSGILDMGRTVFSSTAEHRPVCEGPSTIIGPYKLLQQIGEGGMGVVYMAEQTEPVRRKVALKIIKPGMDSRQVIARFEAERQALAMMDHQNIARVLDAGTTDSGRPYFVMELVHGVPITKFCDDYQLTPRERLALFVPVCQAIQHAHQKGIIHRDVKPSNVLVTLYDDKPVPKVIDFGVAKAIDQRLTEKTLFTQFGALVGTFEYMSPEQAEMNALGVDTRSDIYSLGVLLYELLTGSTPLGHRTLREAALDELLRLIREEEPPRPSARLSTSQNLPKIAADRRTEPGQLSRLLRGEVDWIVMKCLEKDRGRRYETANGVARDLERYLADEAVEACPPSTRYRLSKLARRHRKALTIAAGFAVLLISAVIVSTSLAVWATWAEREATKQRIASDNATHAALEAKNEADHQRDVARINAYANGMELAQRAWEENNVERARELLAEVPHEAGGRDLRGFEWYYLSRLCRYEPRTLHRHTNGVGCLAYSPDGQRLASGSYDNTVKIWDAAGRELLTLAGHTDRVQCVAFSPDGQRLVSGSYDGTVRVWDAVTGQPLLCVPGHADKVLGVAFSPDGQRIASGSADKTVKVWESTTGEQLFACTDHKALVQCVTFSPDGRRLVTGGGDWTIHLRDGNDGKTLVQLNGHNRAVRAILYTPDGRRLVSCADDGTVRYWDSATGQPAGSLGAPAHWSPTLSMSPDARYFASAGTDNSVKVWNSTSGKEVVSLKGHINQVTTAVFSPDGQHLASAGLDDTVRIWDNPTSPESVVLTANNSRVSSIAFSPDSKRLASAGQGQPVRLWDCATTRNLAVFKAPMDRSSSVAFSPDGRHLACNAADGSVILWDGESGQAEMYLKGHAKVVGEVAYSPDGKRLVSRSPDLTVRVWETATGEQLASLEGTTMLVDSVTFSPDGREIATGDRTSHVRVWDSATGKQRYALAGHSEWVNNVAFSPDGKRLASGSWDNTIKIWDCSERSALHTLKGHAARVMTVAFSPDGQRLASGGQDMTVKLWDSVTGKELASLRHHTDMVTHVAFSPDGRRLASASNDRTIYLLETEVSPETLEQRIAHQMVADLFARLYLRPDVLDWLRKTPNLTASRRQQALEVAQTYPEDPAGLDSIAWQIATMPGRAATSYRKALSFAERACQLEAGNSRYLTTLGIAYYRAGNDKQALDVLERLEPVEQTSGKGVVAAHLAFVALLQQRLGDTAKAQATLQRLRQHLDDPRWARDGEVQAFLREAEAGVNKRKASK